MRVRKTLLYLAALALALAPFSYGQLGGAQRPSNRAAEPLTSAAIEPSTVTPTTGDLVVKFTINVKSPIPKNSVVSCSFDASVQGDSSGLDPDEHADAIATLVSGTTYTCTATLHYSWLLTSPSTDKIGISTNTDMSFGYQATATNGTATVVVPISSRHSQQPFGLVNMPANGATTSESVNVTL